MSTHLIAPCGMNCGICLAYLWDKTFALGVGALKGKNQNPAKIAALKIVNSWEG